MKQKLFFLFLMAFFPMAMMASGDDPEEDIMDYDIVYDGLNYKLDATTQTAKIKFGDGAYGGDIVIPETIEHGGVTYTVTAIGTYAFEQCSVTSVTIPSTVTSIGSSAFFLNNGLTSVTIPASVTYIGHQAFSECNLSYITVEAGNPVYSSPNNCNAIIETSTKKLLQGCNNTVVPSDITSIEIGAFQGCHNLSSVNIPVGVTSIGELAFQNCYALQNVVIPEGVTSIEDATFEGCSSLTSVSIPSTVTSIMSSFDCPNLTEVYCYVDHPLPIDAYTFENRYNAILYVPSGCKAAYSRANYWRDFGEIKEMDCSWTDSNSVTWTFTINGSEATITGSDFTSGDMVIPSTVYYNGTAYTMTTIADYAFIDVEVDEEGSINVLGGAPAFTSITIPSSLKKIGVMAFGEGLSPKVIIPDIAAWCNMDFSDDWFTNPLNGSRLFSDMNTEITDLTIPEGVTKISDYAFLGCTSLTSVIIPAGVTSIGEYAFENCSNITSITIPSTVANISEWAFSSICNLETVVSHITEPFAIANNTFEACGELNDIFTDATLYVPAGCVQAYSNTQGWREFSEIKEIGSTEPTENVWTFTTSGSNATITGCSIPVGDLEIPSTVTKDGVEYSVKFIGESAFSGCTSLTGISIPDGVTNIYANAFNGCTGLSNVTVPESVTAIASSAFANCSSLTSMVLSEGLTSLGQNAFQRCTNLTSITIPSTLKTISKYAFSYCSKLTKVFVSDLAAWCGISFGDVNSNPLYYAHHLYSDENTEITELNIPEEVTSIGARAFQGGSSIASVTIPEGVTSIGNYAFSGCSSLTSVTCDVITPLTITANTFTNRTNAILYVPSGSKLAYENAEFWQDFMEIIQPIPTEVALTISGAGVGTYASPYDLDFSGITDFKAYIASGFNPKTGRLVLTQVDEVPAGTGLYVKGTAGTYNIPVQETAMIYMNFLVGLTEETVVSPTTDNMTNFILSNGSYGLGFYTLSKTGTIAAGKAYLSIPTSSVPASANFVGLEFEDEETTGISEEIILNSEKTAGEWYTLDGRKLDRKPSQKGVYILNGRKSVVK